jgi:predicted lipoprotein with Yx(FWY)xxD motif
VKRLHLPLVLSSVTVFGVAVAAFGQSADAGASHTVVTTKNTSLGRILVNGSGQTLYLDVGDESGHFACTGRCAAAWPVLATSGKPRATGKAKTSDLGTIKHGKVTQVTYKGHPLYTFSADSRSSPLSGQGVNGFYVVSPSGNKITKTTKTTTTSPTTTTTTTTTSATTTSSTTPTTTTTTTTTTSPSSSTSSTSSTTTSSSGYGY